MAATPKPIRKAHKEIANAMRAHAKETMHKGVRKTKTNEEIKFAKDRPKGGARLAKHAKSHQGGDYHETLKATRAKKGPAAAKRMRELADKPLKSASK